MTNVTTGQDQDVAELSAADEQALRELTERARAGGLKLTGEGGLLGKLTKWSSGALEGELDDHLGYGKHDPEGRDGGNSRNGRRAKTVSHSAPDVRFLWCLGRGHGTRGLPIAIFRSGWCPLSWSLSPLSCGNAPLFG